MKHPRRPYTEVKGPPVGVRTLGTEITALFALKYCVGAEMM